MPDFVSQMGTPVAPFGVVEFLRSTDDFGTESYTCYAGSIPPQYRDGNPGMKLLQAGTVMAKITSGGGIGKVGPFQSTVGTAEVQTLTPSGTYAGATGNFDIGASGSGDPRDKVLALDIATTAAQLQAVLRAMPAYAAFLPIVTGGPLATGAFTISFSGGSYDGDVPQLTFTPHFTGGAAPNAAAATSTQGVAGDMSDGRQTLANIVGLNLTTLPWQLMERDVEISVVYDCEAIQGWCTEYDLNGNLVPLSNTTAAAMQRGGAAGKMVDIGWH
jgi:hypothetical protein